MLRIVTDHVHGIPVYKVMKDNQCIATLDTYSEAAKEIELIERGHEIFKRQYETIKASLYKENGGATYLLTVIPKDEE